MSDEKQEGITSSGAYQQAAAIGAYQQAAAQGIENGLLTALKELYNDVNWGSTWYDVKGAKEELIARIKKLSKVEKVLYGISEDGEHFNE